MLRRTTKGLLGTALILAALFTLPANAYAAPCRGSSCTGLNPTIGCDADAVTLLYHDYLAENNASFRLEVRYSRICNSAWGRLTVWSGNNLGFALSAWNPNMPSQGSAGHSGNTTWTNMIDGTPLDCTGTQFYVNGNWVRWYYIGCA